MLDNPKCPYCGAEQTIDREYIKEHELFNEDAKYEQECDTCEKTFGFKIHVDISYSTFTADCLNDGFHDWYIQECHPKFMTRRVCNNCTEEQYVYPEFQREEMSKEYFKQIMEKNDRPSK
jgi:hypothetical protein